MNARILEGRTLAATLRGELPTRVEAVTKRDGRAPCLLELMVGNDEGGELYLGNLSRVGAGIGVSVAVERYPDSIGEADLIDVIGRANQRSDVDGVVVAMPLPPQLSSETVSAHLDPQKDVDGITILNAGALYLGRPLHVPSTARAIMALLEADAHPIAGMNAVVVGRSPVVGRPIAMLLLHANATVTVCHTRTANLDIVTRQADILIAAAGRPHLIRATMVKPGAVVVDAGINAGPGGLVGDVDFENVKRVAGAVTPVPGGVGPLTNVLLLASVIQNAEAR